MFDPPDDPDSAGDREITLCPFCGAYSPRSCDLIGDAGSCAWEEMDDAGVND